jgi:predicted nucleic acid-binding protein
VATVEVVGAADLEMAATIRDAFPDQAFSLVDLTCFAVMQRVGLHRVVTFDKDFAIYRFGPRKDRAFTIVNS